MHRVGMGTDDQLYDDSSPLYREMLMSKGFATSIGTLESH